MTASAGALRLVFDTTCLNYFARADRLDVLGDLLAGTESFVPHVVREEIRSGSHEYPAVTQILDVEWLRVVALDTRDRVRRFEIWTSRVGAGTRDLGEASVLAVAEEFDAIALIDERSARESVVRMELTCTAQSGFLRAQYATGSLPKSPRAISWIIWQPSE